MDIVNTEGYSSIISFGVPSVVALKILPKFMGGMKVC